MNFPQEGKPVQGERVESIWICERFQNELSSLSDLISEITNSVDKIEYPTKQLSTDKSTKIETIEPYTLFDKLRSYINYLTSLNGRLVEVRNNLNKII